ncbi:unnamed protein product [Symbiodinium sp. CCMP2592]|nr:unnamed protein product [Symbiodinium sp. CCMP2592]
MLQSASGYSCNLAINGPCVYIGLEAIQYLDIRGEPTTDPDNTLLLRLTTGFFIAWAVFQQVSKFRRFKLVPSCPLSPWTWASSRIRTRSLLATSGRSGVNNLHCLDAGQKLPSYPEWLQRCRKLGIGAKSARRILTFLLRGFRLANMRLENEALATFAELLRMIHRHCPPHTQAGVPYVFWSGPQAKDRAQQCGHTLEKSAAGRLLSGLRILKADELDSWMTERPLWVALSGEFAAQAGQTSAGLFIKGGKWHYSPRGGVAHSAAHPSQLGVRSSTAFYA